MMKYIREKDICGIRRRTVGTVDGDAKNCRLVYRLTNWAVTALVYPRMFAVRAFEMKVCNTIPAPIWFIPHIRLTACLVTR